jgi:hypothetical protein
MNAALQEAACAADGAVIQLLGDAGAVVAEAMATRVVVERAAVEGERGEGGEGNEGDDGGGAQGERERGGGRLPPPPIVQVVAHFVVPASTYIVEMPE